MNNGYIKSWRKAANSELWKDQNAWRVFQWILWNVDYKTGIGTFGRTQLSLGTGIKPNTVYKVTTRLHEKYQVLSMKSNNLFTEISVTNWAKYQQDLEVVTGSVHETEQVASMDRNTIKEERNKEYNIYIPDSQESVVEEVEETPQKTTNHPYTHIIDYCKAKQGLKTNFANYPKQTKAVKLILAAKYTPDDITFVIDEMSSEPFWKDTTFDLMNVYNNMHKYMNRTVWFDKGGKNARVS